MPQAGPLSKKHLRTLQDVQALVDTDPPILQLPEEHRVPQRNPTSVDARRTMRPPPPRLPLPPHPRGPWRLWLPWRGWSPNQQVRAGSCSAAGGDATAWPTKKGPLHIIYLLREALELRRPHDRATPRKQPAAPRAGSASQAVPEISQPRSGSTATQARPSVIAEHIMPR